MKKVLAILLAMAMLLALTACGGMAPAQEEALAFADAADTFLIIGDNETTGNVMTATRSAFAAAMRI